MSGATITCLGFLFFMQCQMPDPPKATAIVCPPLIGWPADRQRAAAAALEALPAGHPLRELADVNFRQRRAVRACQRVKSR